MNLLDIILTVILLWSIFKGWRVGLLRSVLGLASLLIAYGIAAAYGARIGDLIAQQISGEGPAYLFVGFVAVFLVSLLLLWILTRLLHVMLQLSPLSIVNNALGAAVGLAQTVLFLGVVLILARAYPIHSQIPAQIDGSTLAAPVHDASLRLLGYIQAGIPGATLLYQQILPRSDDGQSIPVVDEVSEKSRRLRAKLDSLVKESQQRIAPQ